MEKILQNIVDNYFWFLFISIILIFALVGYFVDMKRKKKNPYKIKVDEEINLEDIEIHEDIALSEMVSKNKHVGMDNAPVNMSFSDNNDNLNNN